MRPTSLGFAALAALVGSAVANPLVPTDFDVAPANDTARLNEGFVPAKLLENVCLKFCPPVLPGLHASKQPAALYCRLRCAADAYRRRRQGAHAPGNNTDRVTDGPRQPDVPLELLPLKKHRLWNTTGIEPRSENGTAPQAAGEKDDGKPDDAMAPRVEEPKGNNPCAWPSEWDGSPESGREMRACLKSCPIGPSFGACLNPCFLEITERRCSEKRAKEDAPKDGKHSALTRRQFQPLLPPPPVNAFTARWWGKAPSWYRPHMHPPISLGGAGSHWIKGQPKLLD
ncbi:hypothetical protein LY76DRAFT_509711 [Colletotrichum caudatum]|nr:hypothetical protein LY76DRAFT_509711 [Colletotrichum caudatum]